MKLVKLTLTLLFAFALSLAASEDAKKSTTTPTASSALEERLSILQDTIKVLRQDNARLAKIAEAWKGFNDSCSALDKLKADDAALAAKIKTLKDACKGDWSDEDFTCKPKEKAK